MQYLKYFKFAYLIFGILFLVDAISKWGEEGNRAYMSLFLCALALFMYFFRDRFQKKYKDKNNS